jgi:hypothetical protein
MKNFLVVAVFFVLTAKSAVLANQRIIGGGQASK